MSSFRRPERAKKHTKKLVMEFATLQGKQDAGLKPMGEKFCFQNISGTDGSTIQISAPVFPENLIFYEHFESDRPLPTSLSFMLVGGGDYDGRIEYDFRQYGNVKTCNFSNIFASVRSIFYVVSRVRSCEDVRIVLMKENIELTHLDLALKDRSLSPLKNHSVKTFRIELADELRQSTSSAVTNSRIAEIIKFADECFPRLQKVKVKAFDSDYKTVRKLLAQKGLDHKHKITIRRGLLNCEPSSTKTEFSGANGLSSAPSAALGKCVERDEGKRNDERDQMNKDSVLKPTAEKTTHVKLLENKLNAPPGREEKVSLASASASASDEQKESTLDGGGEKEKIRGVSALASYAPTMLDRMAKLDRVDQKNGASGLVPHGQIEMHGSGQVDRMDWGSGASALEPRGQITLDGNGRLVRMNRKSDASALVPRGQITLDGKGEPDWKNRKNEVPDLVSTTRYVCDGKRDREDEIQKSPGTSEPVKRKMKLEKSPSCEENACLDSSFDKHKHDEQESLYSCSPYSPWESPQSDFFENCVVTDMGKVSDLLTNPPRKGYYLGSYDYCKEKIPNGSNPTELPEDIIISSDDQPFIEGIHYERPRRKNKSK